MYTNITVVYMFKIFHKTFFAGFFTLSINPVSLIKVMVLTPFTQNAIQFGMA